MDSSTLEPDLNQLLASCLACGCTGKSSPCLRSTLHDHDHLPCVRLARPVRRSLRQLCLRRTTLPRGIGPALAEAGSIALGLKAGSLVAWHSLEITHDLYRATYSPEWTILGLVLDSVPDYATAQLLVGTDLCSRRGPAGIPAVVGSDTFAGQPMTQLIHGEDVDTFFALDLFCSFWHHTVSSVSVMTGAETWLAWLRLRADPGEAFRTVFPLQRSGPSAAFDRATGGRFDVNYALRRECGALEFEEYDRTVHLSYLSLVCGLTLPDSHSNVDAFALEGQLIAQSPDFGRHGLPLSYMNGFVILVQPEARQMWLDALQSLDLGLAAGSPIAVSAVCLVGYAFASPRHRGWEDEMVSFLQSEQPSDLDSWPQTPMALAFRLCFSPHPPDRIALAATVASLRREITNGPDAFSLIHDEVCGLRRPLIRFLRGWLTHCSRVADISKSNTTSI